MKEREEEEMQLGKRGREEERERVEKAMGTEGVSERRTGKEERRYREAYPYYLVGMVGKRMPDNVDRVIEYLMRQFKGLEEVEYIR